MAAPWPWGHREERERQDVELGVGQAEGGGWGMQEAPVEAPRALEGLVPGRGERAALILIPVVIIWLAARVAAWDREERTGVSSGELAAGPEAGEVRSQESPERRASAPPRPAPGPAHRQPRPRGWSLSQTARARSSLPDSQEGFLGLVSALPWWTLRGGSCSDTRECRMVLWRKGAVMRDREVGHTTADQP